MEFTDPDPARDLYSVCRKFRYVLVPNKNYEFLNDWDLWGPFLICIAFSLLLKSNYDETLSKNTGPEFAQVFLIFWIGAIVVTVNSQLLGGSLSLFPTLCALGYCVLPLFFSLIICRIIHAFTSNLGGFIGRGVFVAVGLFYSTFSSTNFIVTSQKKDRAPLAAYPIFLFYLFLSWLVISA